MSRILRRSALALLVAVAVLAPWLLGPARADAAPKRPNDPGFPLQWHLDAIGAPSAWTRTTGEGVTIAIVDSGIDLQHEDLTGKVVGHVACIGTNGNPSTCDSNGGNDDDGHGTHVAGIAAAVTGNGRGVAGVAPDAQLLDVKALEETCDVSGCTASGNADDVAAAIMYAADHGAAVINLSLGNTVQSVFGPSFGAAIEYAWRKGSIPVVAAGNDFALPSGFGDEPAVVVGALNREGAKASYANSIGGAKWALMAPGGEADTPETCHDRPEGILSTYFNNGYACLAGTSMAAPQVSGAAALLRSLGLSPQQTVDRLLSTAKPLGASAVYGSGALDVGAAVKDATSAAVQGTPPSTPVGPLSNAPAPSDSDSANAGGSPAAAPAPPTPNEPAPIALPTAPGRVTTNDAGDGDRIPKGLVLVAALMASSVGGASAWLLLRGMGSPVSPPRP